VVVDLATVILRSVFPAGFLLLASFVVLIAAVMFIGVLIWAEHEHHEHGESGRGGEGRGIA
jgi:hypothetical protein